MPVVTISRMLGALGDEIGEALAEHLGFRLVSRQDLVRLTCQPGNHDEPGWEHSLQEAERSPSFLERLSVDRRRYARLLRRVVVELVDQDKVIIVGLGAGQFLQGLPQVLCSLMVAPDEVRVVRVIEANAQAAHASMEHVLSHEEARKLVRRRDRDTTGYMRYLFQIDWRDACHWDLVINTGRFRVDEAVAILASVVQGGQLTPGPDDRQRLADLMLTGRVEAALNDLAGLWVDGLDVRWVDGLDVRSRDGRVVLEGTVNEAAERDAVGETVQAVEGVRAIDNNVRVI